MRFTGDKTTVRKAFTLLNEKGKPFTDSADSVPSSAYGCTGINTSSSNSYVNSHQQLQQSVVIMKCQFSLQGLQSTLLQTTSKPSVNELQIVHSRDNHWIVASTLISKPNSVSVYDSLYDSIDEESLKVIQYLFGVEEVCVVPVQKQQGYNDCGLFAIAYAVHLAKKHNPEMA